MIYPHYLAYFNALAGGPSRGHEHLIDSNLDWGQDLIQLRHWLDRHPQSGPIQLAYFGLMDPRVLGIDYVVPPRLPETLGQQQPRPADAQGPEPGLYVISVNYVMGLPYHAYEPSDDRRARFIAIPPNAFGYFRSLKPIARAGYSLWIYELSPADARCLRSRFANADGRNLAAP